MIFKFRNIGTIERAEIDLKGITILTGLNNTGKSFIGKAIYSIIKALNGNAERFYLIDKSQNINALIQQIYQTHRQNIPLTPDRISRFNPNAWSNRINGFLFQKSTSLEEIIAQLDDYAATVRQELEKLPAEKLLSKPVKDAIDLVITNHRRIISALTDDAPPEAKYKKYFDKNVIQKLFEGQLNSLFSDNKLIIDLEEGPTKIISVEVENNITTKFSVDNLLLLNDCTIIETPILVQLERFITNAGLYIPSFASDANQGDLPAHYLDLIQKIRFSSSGKSAIFGDVIDEIKKIIQGEFKFNEEQGGLAYIRNGQQIRPNNIATGVKSLGLLQLLLESRFINSNTLLIIDEPEVHLHPSWEIHYAEILVILSKLGIKILISSHSPDIIEGILTYSKKYEAEDITTFYYGTKNEANNNTVFEKTTTLEPIFKALSEPLHQLFIHN